MPLTEDIWPGGPGCSQGREPRAKPVQGRGARLPALPAWPLEGWGSRGAGPAPRPTGRGPWGACPGLPRPSGSGPAVPAERRGAQGCPGRSLPLAAGRSPGSARGTRSPPRGTAQVSAGAAGHERGSAPISRTGKPRGGRHGGGGETVRTAVGAGAHSREKGRTAGSGTAPSRTPALELAFPTLSAVSAGAQAEPKPGCRRFETRRRRPAAHPPRCAPSPGAAPARCRGSRCGGRGEGASLCGEVLLAGPPPPLHRWGN